jgi:hypothetical protein
MLNFQKRICVFCGSLPGSDPIYLASAAGVGRLLAARGIGLVYGGGSVGLMGALADGALNASGEVIGVIPHSLESREVAHRGLTRLETVASMHERKALMNSYADAFLALPGGLGTLEELFEVLTWRQLGLHDKPCGILDVNGFFGDLIAFLDRSVEQGFVREHDRKGLLVDADAGALVERLLAPQRTSDRA